MADVLTYMKYVADEKHVRRILVRGIRWNPLSEARESEMRLVLQHGDDDPHVPPPGLVCSARLGKGPVML